MLPIRMPSLTRDFPRRDLSLSQGHFLESLRTIRDALPEKMRAVADLQLATAARAVEVLDIRNGDVDLLGHVLVHARKRSRDRVVFYPAVLRWVSRLAEHESRPIFWPVTYRQYYWTLHKLGASAVIHTNGRRVVTNIFRRASALMAWSLSNRNVSVAAEMLGHKSLRSTLYYLPREAVTHGKDPIRDSRPPTR